ncbi:MAG: hypothetical protein IT228_08420 [Flavobacteriales bacterium]|nr:hypothetical protein [Flavobacteriales bacterium]MCC6577352.1 hypothetical protein [Flavobacteriales bacterium]NUQ16350.1 hypothetical protein [Flavobacteriales bacterium]
MAQPRTVPGAERVMLDELCGCMGAVDLAGPNTAVEARVRTCLEGAVLRHPAAARALLERSTVEGRAGYRLGQALGDALDRSCEAFGAVRESLRRARGGDLLKKGGT